MNAVNQWKLPADFRTPTGIAVSESGAVWLSDGSTRLLRMAPGAEPATIAATVQGKPARIYGLAPGGGEEMWVVATDDAGQDHAGTIGPKGGEVKTVALPKQPRELAWSKAQSALYYVATDSSLHVYAGGESKPLAEGKFNGLTLAPDGSLLAARNSTSEEVVVSGPERIEWQKRKGGFGGQVIGFDAQKALLLLELGVWEKAEAPPPSQVLAIGADGAQRVVGSGPIVMAAVHGNHLALLRRESSGKMAVELVALG